MSPYGNISGEITDEIKQTFKEGIAAIVALFPFLINLSMKERKAPTIGQKREPIARRLIEIGKQQQEHLPGSFNMDEVESDFSLTLSLLEVFRLAVPMMEKLHETRIAVGAETYKAVRQIRDHLRTANLTEPGLDDVVKEINELFKQLENTEEDDGFLEPGDAPEE